MQKISWKFSDNFGLTKAPHAGANARLQLLLEIYWASLITSNSTTKTHLNCHYDFGWLVVLGLTAF